MIWEYSILFIFPSVIMIFSVACSEVGLPHQKYMVFNIISDLIGIMIVKFAIYLQYCLMISNQACDSFTLHWFFQKFSNLILQRFSSLRNLDNWKNLENLLPSHLAVVRLGGFYNKFSYLRRRISWDKTDKEKEDSVIRRVEILIQRILKNVHL